MILKDDYILAKCCQPSENDEIIGYFSYDNIIKVHRANCTNLDKSESSRLIQLAWKDIIGSEEFQPNDDYSELSETDFKIMNHHKIYGVDYSLKVARMLNLDKQIVFDSHKKLRDLNLLERVKELMMQYRKGIVDNKWIKHRNHTYYNLTEKGEQYLTHYLNQKK